MKRLIKLFGLLSVLCFLCGCGKTTIDLNDYLVINVEGYDSVGVADYEFDYEQMIEDNAECFGEYAEDELKLFGLYVALDEGISGMLSKESKLTNGDSVTFAWNVKVSGIEEEFKVDFVYEPETITVSGLEKASEINPFDYLELTFGGADPAGYIDTLSCEYEGHKISFIADKTEGLRNGDEVTISIDTYGTDVYEYFFQWGEIPTETSKKVVVSGLEKNINVLEDLTEEQLQVLHDDAENTFKTITMHDWIEKDSYAGMEYVGSYLITNLESSYDNDYAYNCLYNVYLIQIDNSENNFKYYYYKYYTDLKLSTEGEFTYKTSNENIPTYSIGWFSSGEYFERGSYIYAGYEKLDDLMDEHIFGYMEKSYPVLTNITDEDYAFSDSMWKDYKYAEAKKVAKDGEYEVAKSILMESGNEAYTEEKLKAIKYELASEAMNKQEFLTAYNLFMELGDYEDALTKAQQVKFDVLEQAEKKVSEGEYFTAYSMVFGLDELGEKEANKAQILDDYLYQQFVDTKEVDIVTFGRYEQDGNAGNGAEPIQWLVLENKDNKLTLLSTKSLIKKGFQDGWGNVYWENCSLRQWLNGDFYNVSFDSQEQLMIATTLVNVSGEQKYENRDYGNNTEDKVYVLSLAEAKEWKELIKKNLNAGEMWLRTLYLSWQDGKVYLCYFGDSNFSCEPYYANVDEDIYPVITIDISESYLDKLK